MTTLPLDATYAVLARMNQGGTIATHWLDDAAGSPGNTGKTRRFLGKMRDVGLVEGVTAQRSGRVFWWSITDKGREFLTTFAHRIGAQS